MWKNIVIALLIWYSTFATIGFFTHRRLLNDRIKEDEKNRIDL